MLHRIATLTSALGVAVVVYAILFAGALRKIGQEFIRPTSSLTLAPAPAGNPAPWWLPFTPLAAGISFFGLAFTLDFFRAQRRHWPGRCKHCGAKRVAERKRCVFCGTVFAAESPFG